MNIKLLVVTRQRTRAALFCVRQLRQTQTRFSRRSLSTKYSSLYRSWSRDVPRSRDIFLCLRSVCTLSSGLDTNSPTAPTLSQHLTDRDPRLVLLSFHRSGRFVFLNGFCSYSQQTTKHHTSNNPSLLSTTAMPCRSSMSSSTSSLAAAIPHPLWSAAERNVNLYCFVDFSFFQFRYRIFAHKHAPRTLVNLKNVKMNATDKLQCSFLNIAEKNIGMAMTRQRLGILSNASK